MATSTNSLDGSSTYTVYLMTDSTSFDGYEFATMRNIYTRNLISPYWRSEYGYQSVSNYNPVVQPKPKMYSESLADLI